MNNSFSWARVGLLIRRYLNENSRSLWMSVGVVFGIMFLMALLFNGDSVGESMGAVVWIIFFFIGGLAVGISSSKTFSSMAEKPGRIVAMMLPASKSEKFTSLMIIYNIFGPIAIILAAMAADALSQILHLRLPYFFDFFQLVIDIFPQIYGLEFVENWPIIIELTAIVILGIFGMILFNQAVYTLGSAWWPKKSFIKTFCLLYALQMCFGIFLSMNILTLNWLFDWLEMFSFDNISWHVGVWGMIILWYAVIFGIFYAAWRRYKSTQLVQKFMMN